MFTVHLWTLLSQPFLPLQRATWRLSGLSRNNLAKKSSRHIQQLISRLRHPPQRATWLLIRSYIQKPYLLKIPAHVTYGHCSPEHSTLPSVPRGAYTELRWAKFRYLLLWLRPSVCHVSRQNSSVIFSQKKLNLKDLKIR